MTSETDSQEKSVELVESLDVLSESNLVQELDVPFALKFGDYSEIPSEDLSIVFLNVLEDSRCPSDVTCVWEGQVRLSFEVSKDTTAEILLANNDSSSVFGSYQIQLVDVKPYPTSTVTINPDDYIAVIKISKNVLPASPLKQFKSGIAIDQIECRESLVLVAKHDGTPACVNPDSVPILVERNWMSTENMTSESSGLCSTEPDVGLCKAAIEKFYFDSETNSCKSFTWGGCGGVVPFDTLESCQSLCK